MIKCFSLSHYTQLIDDDKMPIRPIIIDHITQSIAPSMISFVSI